MIFRVVIALVGAAAITATLLLAMHSVTSVFRESDGTKYFRISDVLTRPDSGRPERPPPVARQPELPESEAELPDSRLPVEPAPSFDFEEDRPAGVLDPELAPADPDSPPD